jgi:nitronate monooxygenase
MGMNALIESSSRAYHRRMEGWVDVALEEGVRFFVTSLGNPPGWWSACTQAGAKVYHDVTERKWALKALDSGVDGLDRGERRAGGHPGPLGRGPAAAEIGDLGLPVVCAGGVGTPEDFVGALRLGYAGVQMGTRFIATPECRASDAYKRAIIEAGEEDIVLSERITGVPVAVIDTPYVQRLGLSAGPIARRMLRGRRSKHLMRTLYTLRSLVQLKRASLGVDAKEYWQAGKSVEGIHELVGAAEVVRRFVAAASRSATHGTPGSGPPADPGGTDLALRETDLPPARNL